MDDLLPVDAETGMMLSAKSSRPGEFLGSLAEKAFAERFHGGYDGLGPGVPSFAGYALTSNASETIKIVPEMSEMEVRELFDFLVRSKDGGAIVILGSGEVSSLNMASPR